MTSPPSGGGDANGAIPKWDYTRARGPAVWGDLDAEYLACKVGRRQSPVNLPGGASSDPALGALSFAYSKGETKAAPGERTLVSRVSAGTLGVRGQAFELVEVRLHSPSEHVVSGRREDLEMHLVHRGSAGETVIVALLGRNGAPDPTLDALLHRRGSLDLRPLLLGKKVYYTYTGSLTTPPCTEGVRWFIFADPIPVSAEQLALLRRANAGDSSRPLQPLGSRIVARYAGEP